jgi:threonine dehydratase
MLNDVGNLFGLSKNINLSLKLENTQENGSFKIRGVINQIKNMNLNDSNLKLVTFSAGNYGKAFAYVCSIYKIKGKVILPMSASESKIAYINSCGVETEKSLALLETIEEHVKKGWKCMQPFDDLDLIEGYASISLEIIEKLTPDIVIVCCGGGGLLAGISQGFNLLDSQARIYGVEPETANTMFESLRQNKAITNSNAKSVATGLAPPMAGKITFEFCKRFANGGIVLVSDEEMIQTMKLLFDRGLKVEPSGCAALAALLNKKVNLNEFNDKERVNVVAILSGGNVSADEISKFY